MNEKYEIAMKMNAEWMELYNSREYNKGRTICLLYEYLKKKNFKDIVKMIRDKITYNIVKKKYIDIHEDIVCNYEVESQEKKVVIYTCILGRYDNVFQPIVFDKNVEFVLFSDEIKEDIGVWKVRKIPSYINELGDVTHINRYIKLHPHEFFNNEYDYCVYIDGNVRVVGNIYSILGISHKSDYGIAMYMHKERDCVYNEAKVCKLYGKGNKKDIDSQMKKYRKEGFPEHFGMFEATIIVSECKNEKTRQIFECWWKEFLTSNSKRDQLALPYVIWKEKLDFSAVGVVGNNILADTRFRIVKHAIHY